MGRGQFLSLCATLACFYFLAETAFAQNRQVHIPRTKFTCTGRASGYYADVDTGCQVYHMCDGLGRQFSYTCPNTTLFQQRMLICDHWYMVNCSMSERDYDANLLIGQRDKPFVSEEEMHFRTPRPDILSVPLNSNYYDGLKEAESKFPVHPGNSIVGIADSISSANNNGLDSGKNNYRPPTSWSTGTNVNRPATGNNNEDQDSLTGAASLRPNPTFRPSPTFQPSTGDSFAPTEPSFIPSESFQPSPEDAFTPTQNRPTVTAPAQDLVPPPQPTTAEASSEEFSLDVRMKEDPVFQFVKRFDPNSPDSHKTAMTKNEILNLNQQLPDGQSSAEEERTPRRNKNAGNNNFNFLQTEKKGNVESSRFDTVNLKPTPTEATLASDSAFVMPTPSRELLPPKSNYSEQPSTTMGPPVYYEWKWAAPAFDLEPPKESINVTANSTQQEKRNITGRSPFRDVRRPTPADIEPTPPSKNTEYNISSYFVPDYLFPLEKGHPGYEDENAETSFQVKVSRPGRASFGENPNCPHCHPAYLNPGTCEPCIVRR